MRAFRWIDRGHRIFKTKRLELELHNIEIQRLCHPGTCSRVLVNWSNCGKVNSIEEDHEKRKDVYDRIYHKDSLHYPIGLAKRFSLIKEVYRDLGRGMD